MNAAPRRDRRPPHFRFFGGKGGVGKTTCAAATALAASEAGQRVLLVSTDPAHSLGDALGVRLGPRPERIRTKRGNLQAVELDADGALERWLGDRRPELFAIAERGTYLDEEDIEALLRSSFPGVDELVGLVELVRLADARRYDEVVVDMAPTGHALRMLSIPQALRRIAGVLDQMLEKHRYVATALGGRYRPDATDALVDEIEQDARRLYALLRDEESCSFAWVLLPEPMALAEAEDGLRTLEAEGFEAVEIVLNRVAVSPQRPCAGCEARIRSQSRIVQRVRRRFAPRPVRLVPALGREPTGPAALRRMARALRNAPEPPEGPGADRGSRAGPRAARRTRSRAGPAWIERIAPPERALLVFTGKGGVGKTTCAAATAIAAADRAPERRVLLLSADPAHSLGDVMAMELGDAPRALLQGSRLQVREIDAGAAFDHTRADYREQVDAWFDMLMPGSRLDATYDRRVIRDLVDLAPPGLDELFAILAVVEALIPREGSSPSQDLVVLDGAPSGHALRLLGMVDGALQWVHALMRIVLKYQKAFGLGDVAAELLGRARELRELKQLLRDPDRTAVVVVTRVGRLPGNESERLIEALVDMELPVGALVFNAATDGTCDACRAAADRERKGRAELVRRVRSHVGEGCHTFVVPESYPLPRGLGGLRRWARGWQEQKTP